MRLASGALVLLALAGRDALRQGSWGSALGLFLYAAPFSYAYVRVEAGPGALVLFGGVQATMLRGALRRGERPGAVVWLGLAISIGGLVALTLPGAGAPDPIGAGLMLVAGVAWGIYSLRGKGAARPTAATAGNFLLAAPLAGALLGGAWLAGAPVHASPRGLTLAAASGAVASGLGYSLWYAALRTLSATTAAALQLLVPILAAVGGVALLGEAASPRLVLAGAAILGGVALAVLGRR